MGLIDLQTDLRNLSYGSGYGEPYIRTPIPPYDSNPTNIYLGQDSIGRNGTFFRAGQDVQRLTGFLNSGKGKLFTLKQSALALTNVQAPYAPLRVFNSANLLLQAGVNGTGTHFNGRGVLPLATKFTGYEYVTKTLFNGSSNRLAILYNSKIADDKFPIPAALSFGINTLFKNTLFSYAAGPDSPLTIINRDTNTSDWTTLPTNFNVFSLTNKELSSRGTIIGSGISRITGFQDEGLTNFTLALNNSLPLTTAKIRILGRITDYSTFNRVTTFGTGDPGNDNNLDRQAYYEGVPKETVGSDKLNLSSIYSSDGVSKDEGYEDMIKFNIAVISNDDPSMKTYVHFRAYIDGITDSFGAEWNASRYPGRGEEFFKYGGFTRDISFGFKVHVQSRAELFPVYQKLNYLTSILAPDYSTAGFMRGNIVQLTVGDYINNMYGVITGFSYSITEDATWDLARSNDGTADVNSAQLPMLITVDSFSFKPIHNFIPRLVTQDDDKISTPKFLSLGATGKGYDGFAIPRQLSPVAPISPPSVSTIPRNNNDRTLQI